MDIPGLGNYTDYTADINSAAADKLQEKLENTKNVQDDEALLDACKQFEAFLWDDDEEEDYASNMTGLFKDEFIQKISEQTVEGGSNSLAQQLYEQAKRNYNL